MGQLFKLKDRCSFVALTGEGLILDPENRTYYRVNETAAIMLHAMNVAAMAGGGISFDDIMNILKIYYFGVDEGKATAFLDQMRETNLIELAPTEAHIPADAAFFPWGVSEIKNFVSPSHEEFGRTQRAVRVAGDISLGIKQILFIKPPKILNRF